MRSLSYTLISKRHNKQGFDCGVPGLNHYLAIYAGNDHQERFTKCYVAADDGDNILGFYTLSSYAVNINALAASATSELPRYPTVPTALLGRLAIDVNHQGKGLGGSLIVDAIFNTINSALGVWAINVEVKDRQAKSFYIKYGFYPFEKNEYALYLPLNDKITRNIFFLKLH
ncbi:GNAT family N-acetyltransferase [Acerihabitans arboris]|uniref:GNAT family N-acetyltransferase n=1 Tax=Acerihabitans arboris TaxID=2691583 RepID=A0A845SFF8_9GAMM|nr:GNAT family N-acetyltransferase [Acerihabitans arboris]NDL63753.1 GNAT family N-acetyltransferase [Acerihabitans arboris]